MIKAVIFDWGGVVAPNPKGGWLDVLADMMNTTVDDLLPHWRSAGYADLSKGIIDEATFWSRFEASVRRPLPDDVSRIWVDGSALNSYSEMTSFIEELRDMNIRVAILSNTVGPMSKIARQSGIYDGFDPIVLSDEIGLIKPDTLIYQNVLDQLQLLSSDCLYVDDLPKNLEPAKAMGMMTVLASDDPNNTVLAIKQALNHKTS